MLWSRGSMAFGKVSDQSTSLQHYVPQLECIPRLQIKYHVTAEGDCHKSNRNGIGHTVHSFTHKSMWVFLQL